MLFFKVDRLANKAKRKAAGRVSFRLPLQRHPKMAAVAALAAAGKEESSPREGVVPAKVLRELLLILQDPGVSGPDRWGLGPPSLRSALTESSLMASGTNFSCGNFARTKEDHLVRTSDEEREEGLAIGSRVQFKGDFSTGRQRRGGRSHR